MRKIFIITISLLLSYYTFHILYFASHISLQAEDSVESLAAQIQDLVHLKELSEAATKPLEKELISIKSKITKAKNELIAAEAQTKNLQGELEARSLQLEAQYNYFGSRIKEQYKLTKTTSPLAIFFTSDSFSTGLRHLTYFKAAASANRESIGKTLDTITKLEKDKRDVETRRLKLITLRGQLESTAKFFDTEIDKAKDYQSALTKQIAELSKRQQEILAAKTGTFQTTVGDVPQADDPASRPDYNPGFSPAFAVFSFGAPHYKGMSQYGAYGRAKSGQNVEDILKAYYGNIEIKKDYRTDITINVQGSGPVDIETYTKRIYEMPTSWADNGGMEALKAQAVAARSYALAYTNNGSKSICATESCQVYKPSNKGGKWDEAVEATKGWVLVSGGQPFSAWYASTSGGYQVSYSAQGHTTPGFWDTPSGRSGWTSQAYEKQANSPWFYKGWYKDRGGDSCGLSHPWLNGEELADILNAWVVLIKSNTSDDRITPRGSCWGGNPYSIGELRSKADSNGGGYSKVDSVSVTYSENGSTAQVTFNTNRGSITIPGSDFKKAFNLRAPGKISVKSNLYNIERK